MDVSFGRAGRGVLALLLAAPALAACNDVTLGTDKVFGPADFDYHVTKTEPPAKPDADNKVDASLAGGVARVLAMMDAAHPNPNHIWAAQLVGATFKVGGAGKRVADITFTFDDYAYTRVGAGDNSTADATYTIRLYADPGEPRVTPLPIGDVFDLHAMAKNHANDTNGGNDNKNQTETRTVILEGGKTYTAALQAMAEAEIHGVGSAIADGKSNPPNYQMTLKSIAIHFH